jgi:8-oxo-dGTP diphosphatase
MTQHTYKKNHIVTSVVAVIVNDDGEVLLTKRQIPPFQGEWVMPGGKINLGEPITDALQREVREEVGLAIEVQDLIDVFEHLTPGDNNYHFVIIYYRCRPLSCDLMHNRHEVEEACWVKPEDISAYPMPDGTRFILGKVFPFHRRKDD